METPTDHPEHSRSGPLGWAVFGYGFRPFFLAAGIQAALAMVAWLAWMGLHLAGAEVTATTIAMPLFVWHGHEMLFGYAGAVIAGFLLTAQPNWTGSGALRGGPLAALAAVWLAGRLAVWLSAYLPPLAVALVDLSFLPLLASSIAVPLVRARAWRNMVFLPLLGVLFAADVLVHAELLGALDWGAATGHLLAIDLIVLLIVIVGGRIVPAFTANWLKQRGEAAPVLSWPWLDGLAIVATVLVLLADLVDAPDPVRGALALAAAALHLARLAGWQSGKVLGVPILWILHLGYGWLVVGFGCKALALLGTGLAEITALHAFTAGAVGSMTLGVMTRAALGHTGRPLEVARWITAAYVLVSLGAAVRVAGPALAPEFYGPATLVSGGLWALAFAIFAATYWPILTRPRLDGLAG